MVAALKLARATRRIMGRTRWAAGYNPLAGPIAAGALWAALGVSLARSGQRGDGTKFRKCPAE
jgi:hypothetical protein